MVNWRRIFLICNLFFKKNCIFLKSDHHLPYYFREHCIFMSNRLCLPYFFGEHCIFMSSRLCLPYYFGEYWIFVKSRLCLPYYFEEHCIIKRSFQCSFTILSSTIKAKKKLQFFLKHKFRPWNVGLFSYPFPTYCN